MKLSPQSPISSQLDHRLEADRIRLLHDEPARLPASRGPVSEALLGVLDRAPDHRFGPELLRWAGPVQGAVEDEDLQLSLWLTYELRYRGLAGVADDWERNPDLTAALDAWESVLLSSLQQAVDRDDHLVSDPVDVVAALWALAGDDRGPSLSQTLMRDASAEQFREFLVHRSIYHLKEADPHTWAIPRLSGAVKAAMITIQSDEYGGGTTAAMHAQLFRRLLQHWQLDDRYGAHLDRVPAVTLLSSNIISLFGLRRRWRGALVGHLSLFEMTSSSPNARYARGHRRLGGSDDAAAFFDEHVVADAVHEQLAAHELAGALARTEPGVAADILFGARCAALADRLFGDHLLQEWGAGRTSLRTSGELVVAA